MSSSFFNSFYLSIFLLLKSQSIFTNNGFGKLNIRSHNIFIPDDIIVTLLLPRLPVKSLLKFKCVSKSWNSLISSRKFMKTQLEFSTRKENLTNHTTIIGISGLHLFGLVIVPIHQRIRFFEPCSFYEFDLSFSLSVSTSLNSVFLVGSCNGISCALTSGKEGKEFLLCNSSMRKVTLYDIIESEDTTCIDPPVFWGFGFDESKDEYKVLLGGLGAEGEFFVHLYGFKSSSVKAIDKDPFEEKYNAFMDRAGTFVEGKLYWLMKSDNLGLDIVCFDIEIEKYGGVVEKPTNLDSRLNPTIGVFGGCLCIVSGDPQIKKDVWVLRKCWEKVTSIPYFTSWGNLLLEPKPLCMTSESEIAFSSRRLFYSYDSKMNSSPNVISCPLSIRQMMVCTQSLVWPFCDGGKVTHEDSS